MKKLFTILLILAMVVSTIATFGISASAVAHNVGSVTFTQALDSSFVGGALESNNYYLNEDLTLTQNITVASGKTVKLCLNGYVLNLNGHYIENSGDLGIFDDSVKHYRFSADTNGLWIPNEGGSLEIEGGYIIGGSGKTVGSYTYGGAVYNYGTLTLNGGSIVGNTADRGGAVFLDKNGSVFTMNGGHITGNTSTNEGAGVYVHNGATFTMNDGHISNNCVINNAKGGGGVYTHGTFIMNGGNINSNKAKSGAGVYVYYYNDANHPGVFTMTSNGIIRFNTASDKGGGVYVDDHAEVLLCGDITGNTAGTLAGGVCCNSGITVGGELYMENNKVGTTESNLVLRNDNKEGKITVSTENPLTEDAYIGLTRLDANKKASNGVVSTNGTANDVQSFYSDAEGYSVMLVGGVLTLTSTATYLDNTTPSKELDQNYTLDVTDNGYTDVTKVKVEWAITDITVTRTDSKIWDPDNLVWKDVKEASVTNNGSATFKITNLSSVKVGAQVEFSAVSGFNSAVSYNEGTNTAGTDDGKVVVNTVVRTDRTVDTENIDNTAVIKATVTPDADDFKSLTATTTPTKYGTYTVTLSSVNLVTVFFSGASNYNYTLKINNVAVEKDAEDTYAISSSDVVTLIWNDGDRGFCGLYSSTNNFDNLTLSELTVTTTLRSATFTVPENNTNNYQFSVYPINT